jgi:hypothetical protein
MGLYLFLNMTDQMENILGLGIPRIENKIGMTMGNFCTADTMTF